MKKSLIFTLLILVSNKLLSQANAISIEIAKPTFNLEIKYGLLSQEVARLDSKEQSIATLIKPLTGKIRLPSGMAGA